MPNATTMRALRFARFGAPEVLEVVDVPRPGADAEYAVVRVEAAGVNPSDVKNVAGAMEGTTLPRVPGREFAGTVADGPAEWVGRAVWGTGAALGFSRDGTHAEYVRFPAAALRARPQALGIAAAAGVPVTFLTAWLGAVDGVAVRAGETMLVVGAAGGVGSAVVQLAHWRGARVVGVVRGPVPDDVPAAARPDVVIQSGDHQEPGALAAAIRAAAGGRGASCGYDTVGGRTFEEHLGGLAQRGRMAVIASTGERRVSFDLIDFYRRELHLVGVDSRKHDAHAAARVLGEIAAGFDAGALAAPQVARTVPLDRARAAYEAVAGGTRGRVVLVPGKR